MRESIDLLEPGRLDALEEDRTLLAQGAEVRLELPWRGENCVLEDFSDADAGGCA